MLTKHQGLSPPPPPIWDGVKHTLSCDPFSSIVLTSLGNQGTDCGKEQLWWNRKGVNPSSASGSPQTSRLPEWQWQKQKVSMEKSTAVRVHTCTRGPRVKCTSERRDGQMGSNGGEGTWHSWEKKLINLHAAHLNISRPRSSGVPPFLLSSWDYTHKRCRDVPPGRCMAFDPFELLRSWNELASDPSRQHRGRGRLRTTLSVEAIPTGNQTLSPSFSILGGHLSFNCIVDVHPQRVPRGPPFSHGFYTCLQFLRMVSEEQMSQKPWAARSETWPSQKEHDKHSVEPQRCIFINSNHLETYQRAWGWRS